VPLAVLLVRAKVQDQQVTVKGVQIEGLNEVFESVAHGSGYPVGSPIVAKAVREFPI